jgi:alpha-tubulin suppressor-like RCC1 family protein
MGGLHACVLLEAGDLKCWGLGAYGALGRGNFESLGDEPNELGEGLAPVDLGGRVGQVAVGVWHNCAFVTGSGIKCWGYNSSGRLGQEDEESLGTRPEHMGRNLPFVKLGSGLSAQRVAIGNGQTCAIFHSGKVKCWGANDFFNYGQLGLGLVGDQGDDEGEMGDGLAFVDLGTDRTALDVFPGNGHTCARLDNGASKCWGFNNLGQLGTGDTEHRGDEPGEMGDKLPRLSLGSDLCVLAFALGRGHSCALLSDYGVKCWGRNEYGALGWGNTDEWDLQTGDALPYVDLSF